MGRNEGKRLREHRSPFPKMLVDYITVIFWASLLYETQDCKKYRRVPTLLAAYMF